MHCNQITDTGFQYLGETLQSLYINYCNNIIDNAFQYIPRSLYHLHIYSCDGLTDNIMPYLKGHIPNFYFDCSDISSNAFRKLGLPIWLSFVQVEKKHKNPLYSMKGRYRGSRF